MTAINATKAKECLYQLISDVNENGTVITIANNKGKNAVLLSEDYWKSIQETLYIMSFPGLTESIVEGGKIPVSECLTEQAANDIESLKAACFKQSKKN